MISRERLQRLRASQLGGLAGDAVYVGIWQGAMAAADLLQIVLLTRSLGLEAFGTFSLLLAVVTIAGQLFTVRSGIAATTFAAPKLGSDNEGAAGVFQMSLVAEQAGASAGVLAMLVVAPFVGDSIGGATGGLMLVLLAIGLWGQAAEPPAVSALRLLGRFRLVAIYTVCLQIGRVAVLAAALQVFDTLLAGIVAITLFRLVSGAVNLGFAASAFRSLKGSSRLLRPSISAVPRSERRAIVRTMLNTNVIAYARVAQTQLPVILLGAMAGKSEVAIFKIGIAAAAAVGRIIDPATAALLPRLSGLIRESRWVELKRLIAHATLVSTPITLAMLAGLIVFREPILTAIGGTGADAASTVLILGSLSQALYAVTFWRAALLYALHRTGTVSVIAIAATVVQIGATFALVPSFGANGAATALLAGSVLGSVALTWLAIRSLREPWRQVDAHIERLGGAGARLR